MQVKIDKEQEQQSSNLPIELVNEKIEVIDIPALTFGIRKAFINLKHEHTQFKYGIRVLPAQFVGIPDQGAVYFKKYHEPNEKYWKDGGYECFDTFGGIRSFFLDALMIHPSEMKKSERVDIEGLRKRGRKSNPNKIQRDPNLPKGKRGRKPLDPEERTRREAEKQSNYTGKRGRPKIDPSLKKTLQYVKTGKPRGRPRKPIEFEL